MQLVTWRSPSTSNFQWCDLCLRYFLRLSHSAGWILTLFLKGENRCIQSYSETGTEMSQSSCLTTTLSFVDSVSIAWLSPREDLGPEMCDRKKESLLLEILHLNIWALAQAFLSLLMNVQFNCFVPYLSMIKSEGENTCGTYDIQRITQWIHVR